VGSTFVVDGAPVFLISRLLHYYCYCYCYCCCCCCCCCCYWCCCCCCCGRCCCCCCCCCGCCWCCCCCCGCCCCCCGFCHYGEGSEDRNDEDSVVGVSGIVCDENGVSYDRKIVFRAKRELVRASQSNGAREARFVYEVLSGWVCTYLDTCATWCVGGEGWWGCKCRHRFGSECVVVRRRVCGCRWTQIGEVFRWMCVRRCRSRCVGVCRHGWVRGYVCNCMRGGGCVFSYLYRWGCGLRERKKKKKCACVYIDWCQDVYMYVWVCVCRMRVCKWVCVCASACVGVSRCVYAGVSRCVCVSVCGCRWVCVCECVCVGGCMCVYALVCVEECVYRYIYGDISLCRFNEI
jgi:hypothetical protein